MDDLKYIRQHIERDNPEAARQTVKTIYDGLRALKSFPHRGRQASEDGTRELVFTPFALRRRLSGDADSY